MSGVIPLLHPICRHGEDRYNFIWYWFRLIHYGSVYQTFLLTDPFWLRKITTDHYIRVYANVECLLNRCSELKIYASDLILGSYEYTPIT